MKLKKIVIGSVVLLVITAVAIGYLANRDIDRIYGGLTKEVDSSIFQPLSGAIAVTGVNVLSSDGERFIPGQTVMIEDGKIVSVNAADQDLDRFHVVDGQGKFLIPGLIDSHIHLFKSPNDLLLYVANGVTEVREMIGEEGHLKWRTEIEQGRIGPDMFIASPRIGSFGTLEGAFMEWSQGFINLQNPKQARKSVRQLHAQGYDAVKIYSQINEKTYYAVAETARSLGMKVVGHVPWSTEMEDVYANQHEIAHLEEVMNAMNRKFGDYGYSTTEEFLSYVESQSGAIAQHLASNDIAVTSVLWLVESFVRQKFELETVLKEVELEYENPGISEWTERVPQGGLGWLPGVNRYQVPSDWSEEKRADSLRYWETYAQASRIILRSLVENNVTVLAGTDTNLPPTVAGFSLHDELVSMRDAGMSNVQVLKSATSEPAKWLGSNTGRIAAGLKANLLLLDANPLLDIQNTRTVNAVFQNGQLFDRTLLDSMLLAVKEANDSSRKIDISHYACSH